MLPATNYLAEFPFQHGFITHYCSDPARVYLKRYFLVRQKFKADCVSTKAWISLRIWRSTLLNYLTPHRFIKTKNN